MGIGGGNMKSHQYLYFFHLTQRSQTLHYLSTIQSPATMVEKNLSYYCTTLYNGSRLQKDYSSESLMISESEYTVSSSVLNVALENKLLGYNFFQLQMQRQTLFLISSYRFLTKQTEVKLFIQRQT